MGIEEKISTHRSLRTPGNEDFSPWPPVGQLPFEKITGMSEEEIDRAFLERHGLKEVFKSKDDTSPNKQDGQQLRGSDQKAAARELKLKRIALARLEGIGLGPSSPLWGWYGSSKTDSKDPTRSLRVTLKNVLNDECKKRIEDVWKHIAREAAVFAPYPKLRELEQDIQQRFLHVLQEPLSIRQIFNAECLPSHAGGGLQSTRINLETGLELYKLKMDGDDDAECAIKLNIPANSIHTLWNRYFTESAREASKTVSSLKRRLDTEVA